MATFLVTPRMSPALAARVEASVRGRKVDRRQRWPRALALAGLLTALVFAGFSIARTRGERSDALEARRSRLLESFRERAGATALDLGPLSQTQALLLGLDRPYEGDWASDALATPERASTLLLRPTLYVRAPLESFDSDLDLGHAAEGSFRDAFLLCLHDPPATRTEKALAARSKAAFAGGEALAQVAHVERLHDALAGLYFLTSDWEDRVRRAETEATLAPLSRTLADAPIEASLRALRAELVLVVADEAKTGNGPTELDGACPHFARIHLFDANTAAPLARLRRFVDPSKLSDDVRIAHANGVNGCELGLEARAAWGLPAPR